MSPERLIKYIKNPEQLDDNSIVDITLLAEKYPYFQTAQILRAKNLYNLSPANIKSVLNFTAAYVTDRKVLYYLLHPIEQKAIVEEPQEFNDPKAVDSPEDKKIPEKDIKETIQENLSDTLNSQIEYLNNNTEEEIEFSTSLNLKKEYGEGIVLDDYVVTINNGNEDFIELIDSEDNSSDKKEPQIKQDQPKQEMEDILHMINKGIVPTDIEQHTSDQLSDNQKKNNSIINNFIKANPKIKPVEKPSSILNDISEQSIQENDHLITDTLANIYLKQGNYAKAIYAYEKLCLKYPEKSAYFASQIEEIKKIIDKNK